MRVAVIGTGRMGAPMARRIAGAGHEVAAFDLSTSALTGLAGAAKIRLAEGIEDAASGAEIVVTMLPDGRAVAAAATALGAALPEGALVIEMSTAGPMEAATLRDALRETVGLIDAPVSGGVARAVSGTLTIMAGGEAALVARAAPVLEAMGTVTHCGALGAGRAMKLLNNYLSASGLAAACEAVAVGRRFGLDPDLMAEVFSASTGSNNATEVKLRQQINNGAYASGFAMGLMAKDLTLGREMAAALGVTAEGLEAMQALYAEAEARLGGSADHTEVAKLLGLGE